MAQIWHTVVGVWDKYIPLYFPFRLSVNQEQLLVLMGRNFKTIFKTHYDALKSEEFGVISEKTYVETLVMAYGEQRARLANDDITANELER